MSPQVIGNRYRLRSVLARRGPVASFLAGDDWLGRDVVLAVTDPGGFGEPLTSAAEVVSAVGHPGFLPVLEIGGEDERRYVAFELPAETLTGALAREPWGAREVRDLGVDLALALGALHGHGVVHGALHPGAVGLDAEGRALLALAPLAPPPPGWGGERAFTASEQLAGAAPTPEGDVFAFGAVLLSALVGDGPGPLEAPATVALADRLRMVGEPALLGVIGSSLARDPRERPRSLHDVASCLAARSKDEGYAGAEGPSVQGAPAPMARWREHGGFGRGVVALAVTALVILVLVRVGDRPPNPSVALHLPRRGMVAGAVGARGAAAPAMPPARPHQVTAAQGAPGPRPHRVRPRPRPARRTSTPRQHRTERLVLTAARRSAPPPVRRRPPLPPAGGRAPGPPSRRGVARVARAEPHGRPVAGREGRVSPPTPAPARCSKPSGRSGPHQAHGWPWRGQGRPGAEQGRPGAEHGRPGAGHGRLTDQRWRGWGQQQWLTR